MFRPIERWIAFRYLRARRQEGAISLIAGFSLLGIALGVATLIVVMSVMNGFRAELMDRILGLNGHLALYGAEHRLISDYDALAARLAETPGVARATAIVDGQVMATAHGRAQGAVVFGLDPDAFADRPILARGVQIGSAEALRDPDNVIVGHELARRLGLGEGDHVTLISPEVTATAFGTLPRTRAYRVGGLLDVGMFEYDSRMIYMPIASAQTFLRARDGATLIEVFLEDADLVDALRPAIIEAAGDTRLRIVDWQQANSSFFTALKVERNVMFLILTLIILVAAFNIISSLIMLVKDKGKDIAILRTVGASRATILRVFVLAGASIGVLGTLLGTGLGLLVAGNVDRIRGLDRRSDPDRALVARAAVPVHASIHHSDHGCSPRCGNGAWPVVSRHALSRLAAARLDPVEALRYE